MFSIFKRQDASPEDEHDLLSGIQQDLTLAKIQRLPYEEKVLIADFIKILASSDQTVVLPDTLITSGGGMLTAEKLPELKL